MAEGHNSRATNATYYEKRKAAKFVCEPHRTVLAPSTLFAVIPVRAIISFLCGAIVNVRKPDMALTFSKSCTRAVCFILSLVLTHSRLARGKKRI